MNTPDHEQAERFDPRKVAEHYVQARPDWDMGRLGAAYLELNARWQKKWQGTVDLHVRELSEARAQLAERERERDQWRETAELLQRDLDAAGSGEAG